MRQSTIAVLAVGLCVGTTGRSAAQPPAAIERVERERAVKQFQGIWVPDLLVTPAGAERYPLGGRALYFDGSAFTRIEGARAVASGTFQAELGGFLRLTVTSRQPWDLEAGGPPPDAKEVIQYAYKVDGDILTLCYTAGGKGKAGDLTPAEGRQVVVYKRHSKLPSAGGQ